MPIEDHFSSFGSGLDSPATGGFSITPDDDADLAYIPRAIMVATSGDVSVIMKDGSAVVLPALEPGVPYPIRVKRVLENATTASGIVGLY